MALTVCDECGANVSTGAKTCPGCGAGPKVFAASARRARQKRLGLIFVGFIVFAIVLAKILTPTPRPPTPEEEQTERATHSRLTAASSAARALRNSARDPDSVVFESILADELGEAICIRYRARNGFGGMNRGAVVYVDGTPSTAPKAWNAHCARRELYDVTGVSRMP